MWTELDFNTSSKTQVTPCAAPDKLKSSASHKEDVQEEALAVLAQTQAFSFPSQFFSPRGHYWSCRPVRSMGTVGVMVQPQMALLSPAACLR